MDRTGLGGMVGGGQPVSDVGNEGACGDREPRRRACLYAGSEVPGNM